MPAIGFALLVTAACGTMATGAYFAFSDDRFTRLIGHQTQSYEDQIADLRAQIDRISRLDQERVEQQIKPLLQRQASLEQVTSGLAKDLAIQARNSLPASGTIGTTPLLSPIETPSAPIVSTPNVESAKQAESAKQTDRAIIRDKKPHRRKYVRVKRKRMQEASTVAVGHNAYAEPAGQRNY
jgi:TolA-binding protein